MNIFKSKAKSPQDMVKNLREALAGLNNPKKSSDKATEEATKALATMRAFIYPQGEGAPSNQAMTVLAQEAYQQDGRTDDLFTLLINNLGKLEFEARKDAAQIFNNLLRRQLGTRAPTVEYLCVKESLFKTLILGYEDPEIALSCGLMLREAIKYEALAKILLLSDHFENFFRYVELPMFDIASDATLTFKLLLTKHKVLCASFLEEKYDWFMKKYASLLNSENYVTQRQSLKLLGELLLDRANFNIMTKYISNPENLKLMMTMLRNESRNIQFEAFHVFKVFVANPNKPPKISAILIKNKERLSKFLSNFQCDRSEDEQFGDEKAYLIKQIEEL